MLSEEFARARQRLRVGLQRHPRYRIIVYPLLLALIVAAGVLIATSLMEFSTSFTFSYD
jgi:hypothetical protein